VRKNDCRQIRGGRRDKSCRKNCFEKEYSTDVDILHYHNLFFEDFNDSEKGKELNKRENYSTNNFSFKFKGRSNTGINYSLLDFNRSSRNPLRSGLQIIARTIALREMDDFLLLQHKENRWIQWKQLTLLGDPKALKDT